MSDDIILPTEEEIRVPREVLVFAPNGCSITGAIHTVDAVVPVDSFHLDPCADKPLSYVAADTDCEFLWDTMEEKTRRKQPLYMAEDREIWPENKLKIKSLRAASLAQPRYRREILAQVTARDGAVRMARVTWWTISTLPSGEQFINAMEAHRLDPEMSKLSQVEVLHNAEGLHFLESHGFEDLEISWEDVDCAVVNATNVR